MTKKQRARAKATAAAQRLKGATDFSLASSSSPQRTGVGLPSITGYPRINRRAEVVLSSEDALSARVAVDAGPYNDRISTYPGSNLSPLTLDAIFRSADLGVGIYRYADFTFQMRRRDAHLKGVDRQRRQAVANKPFLLWPRIDVDPICVALAHAGRAIVDGIDGFNSSIYELLSKNCDGWGISEIVWRRGLIRFQVPDGSGGGPMVSVEGLWPRSLYWVHPKHTEFTQDSADEPLLNLGPDGTVRLPKWKFIYSLCEGEGLASTRGYSQAVAWPHFFKHASIRDWNVFLHIYGIPFLQGKMDRSLWKDTTMRAVLEQALAAYGDGEHAVILPDGMSIEVNDPVSMGGAGDAHKSLAGFMNAEQSKAVLGVTLTTEPGESGSYNLGVVHRDSEQDVIAGDAIGTADDVRADVLLAAIEVNADALAQAFSDNGIAARPELLPLGLPQCGFRIDREWSPEVRMRLYALGLESGIPMSKSQVRRELQFDAPTSPSDELKGKAVTVADGAAAVGSTDASKGVDNPKDQPPPKAVPTPARPASED